MRLGAQTRRRSRPEHVRSSRVSRSEAELCPTLTCLFISCPVQPPSHAHTATPVWHCTPCKAERRRHRSATWALPPSTASPCVRALRLSPHSRATLSPWPIGLLSSSAAVHASAPTSKTTYALSSRHLFAAPTHSPDQVRTAGRSAAGSLCDDAYAAAATVLAQGKGREWRHNLSPPPWAVADLRCPPHRENHLACSRGCRTSSR